MVITSKGQVTIPQEIRRQTGLLPQTEVDFIVDGNSVRIVARQGSASAGQRAVQLLRGSATVRMTTDQILALTRDEA
jgi:AbrB family looped-hinge helix DNA binding protein